MKSEEKRSNSDNRMGWIRSLEELERNKDDKGTYIVEYEILSECLINGLLDYDGSKILCGLYSAPKSNDGLYSYLFKITYQAPRGYNVNANSKGYHFKEGVIGELLALFSLFYRCRFYLSASIFGELTGRSLKIKTNYDFPRIQCNPVIHPPIFTEEPKNFSEINIFLDKIRRLNPNYHQQFILACGHYLRALKEIGIDPEMVYITLVSAVEALFKFFELKNSDDPLKGKNINDVAKLLKYSKEEKTELNNIFETRKALKKFLKYIDKYSKGYFKGGNYKANQLIIKKKDLPQKLKAIYNARSDYLHNGEPMYLSKPFRGVHGADKWHTDPSVGMIMDKRRFPEPKKLPYSYWFEGLVRHCLLNFLEEKLI